MMCVGVIRDGGCGNDGTRNPPMKGEGMRGRGQQYCTARSPRARDTRRGSDGKGVASTLLLRFGIHVNVSYCQTPSSTPMIA